MMRGRGMNRYGGYGGRSFQQQNSAGGYPLRPPFDLTLCEPMFPKVREVDDTQLTQVSRLMVQR